MIATPDRYPTSLGAILVTGDRLALDPVDVSDDDAREWLDAIDGRAEHDASAPTPHGAPVETKTTQPTGAVVYVERPGWWARVWRKG